MKTRKSAAALITASLATAAGVALIPAALAAPSDTFTIDGYTYTYAQCNAGNLSQSVQDLSAVTGERGDVTGSLYVAVPTPGNATDTSKSYGIEVRDEGTGDVAECTLTYTKAAPVEPSEPEQPAVDADFLVDGHAVTVAQCKAGDVKFEVADKAALEALTGEPTGVDDNTLRVVRGGAEPAEDGTSITFPFEVTENPLAEGSEPLPCTVVFSVKDASSAEGPSEPAVDADFFVNGHAVTVAQCKAGDVKFEVEDKAALEALTGEVTGVDDNTLRVVKGGAKPAEDGMSITFPFEVTENPLAADSEELPCNVVFSVKGASSAEEPTDATETAKPAEGEKAAAQAEAPKALAQTGAAAGLIATLAAGLVAAGVVAVRRARKQA